MPEKITVLRVGAKRNGYRRAGLQFGEAAASIPLSALTSHQVKELRTDRMLATQEAEAVVLLEAEYEEQQRVAAIGCELIASLPADFTWTRTPVEYVANLVEQLRVQTERANGLQGDKEALLAKVDELEAKHAAKANSSKPSHANGSR